MKKFIYTIGFLMFVSGVLNPLLKPQLEIQKVLAETSSTNAAENSDENLAGKEEEIFKKAFQEANNKLDFGNSFGASEPKKVGQNLYALIYERTQLNPTKEAIKETAAQYGLPPERMGLILRGDLTPILQAKPTLSQEDAEKIYRQMKQVYTDRKDLNLLTAEIKAKVEPNEIFYNDDLADSGFDLINDLNNLEILLFKKAEKIDIGGQLGTTSQSDKANNQQQATAPAALNQPIKEQTLNDTSTNQGLGATSSQANTNTLKAQNEVNQAGLSNSDLNTKANSNQTDQLSPNSSTLKSPNETQNVTIELNPNQCSADQGLQNALMAFATKAKTDQDYKDKGNNLNQSDYSKQINTKPTSGTNQNTNSNNNPVALNNGLIADKNTDSGGGSDPTASLASAIDLKPSIDNPVAPISLPPVTAKAADWSKPPICDEIICLSLDFVKKQAEAVFGESDNCIACHIEYINQKLQKTTSYSLVPNKAPGNLGEPAKCKNAASAALTSLSLNISFSAIPIITPAKDDLVTLGNISDEWNSFAEKAGGWSYTEDLRRETAAEKTGAKDYSPQMTLEAREALRVISTAPEGITQAELNKKINNSIETQENTQAKEALIAQAAKNSADQSLAGLVLRDEMKQMNDYFSNFSKTVESLYQDVPGISGPKACEELKNKPECT